MDLYTSAALIVGIRAVGPTVANVVEDFAKRLLGPVVDATGQAISSPIVQFNQRRAERFGRMITQAAETLHERHIEPQSIPDHLLLPLLQHGSLVEDSDLQTVWAQMIASASSGSPECGVWPSFPQILSELTPQEVKVLSNIYDYILQDGGGYHGLTRVQVVYFTASPGEWSSDVNIMEDNFMRLQLLRPPHPVMRGDEVGRTLADLIQSKGQAHLHDLPLEDNRRDGMTVTSLGWAFLKACAGPLAPRLTPRTTGAVITPLVRGD